jgi:hypothetical protein
VAQIRGFAVCCAESLWLSGRLAFNFLRGYASRGEAQPHQG